MCIHINRKRRFLIGVPKHIDHDTHSFLKVYKHLKTPMNKKPLDRSCNP